MTSRKTTAPPTTSGRRQFLKSAAGAVLGLPVLVRGSVLGQDSPSNQTTVACIGVGNRGGGLLQEVASQESRCRGRHLRCLANRRENSTRWVNQHYGRQVCKPYRDLRELLARDDIDAVVIATPDHWHVPAALMAVRSGKDVYVEKPLGLSMERSSLFVAK